MIINQLISESQPANLSGYGTGIVGATVVADQTAIANFVLIANPGNIDGNVSNIGLSPISGAEVKILLNNVEIASAFTDNAGNYSFSGLPPGSYIITASAVGYRTGLLGGNVLSGQTSTLNFLLSPNPGEILGNVSDVSGNPLSGVSMEVVFNGVTIATIITDNNGNYEIPGLVPGPYQVFANAAGYQSQFMGANVLSDQTTRADFVLIPKPGILFGNVSELGGPIIPGAIVTASINGVSFAPVITDSLGDYFIFGLPPGSYTVTASAHGYGSEILGALVQPERTTEVNFKLNPNPGTLTGQVTDENGTALSGIFIEVNLGNFLVITAMTDNTGQYYVSGLKPGAYFLNAKAAGYRTQIAGATILSNITTIVDFTMKANPGNIQGNVSSSGGTLIEGALITAYFNNIAIATALTDNLGNYIIPGLPPGYYVLIASKMGYGGQTVGGIVKPDQTSTVDFILTADPGVIEGKVTDNQGSPLPGITIEIHLSNTLIATALTDVTGNYNVPGLKPASHTVFASTSGYQIGVKNAVQVNANQTTIVNFTLVGNSSTVKGTITDAMTHLPISGVIVDVIQKEQIIATTITDNDGHYLVTILAKGDYTLSASGPGYFPGSTSFTVGSGETVTVNLPLQPSLNHEASVTGEIYDCEKGKQHPIPGAMVQLFQGKVFIGEAFTDNQGMYLFSPINPGKYVITATAEEYLPATDSFSVELDQKVKVNIPLCLDAPPRDLKVKVRKNKFLTQSDWIDHLTWKASKSHSVKYYAIYLNGHLIAKVSAKSQLEYNNHNQPKHKKRVYAVVAVYQSGVMSTPAKVKVK